ncbi:MAG: pyruvate dehydrogenase (acetyl-transferring) E1 component subunit alpha [Chloroflexia bacterium]|jgi:pyruvate dehydrogenase E1 component alpha subunit|nr:pyruvate dehydrogenase (acetyl-transferring) E1 component subunit alpha [Chloroflexia bacterium]
MATTQSQGKRRRAASTPAKNGSKGSPNSKTEPRLGSDALVSLYQKMVEIRLFEDAAQRGFRQGKVGGYMHVYSGQEAVATGFLDTFREPDYAITAYRDHAHVLLLGSDPKAVMAELYGKGTGLVQGKGGSMHLFDVSNGFYGGYGIVGGHIPLGVGMAFAQAYQKTGGITQLYLGDGAIHNGAFHEAANLSGLWGRDGLNPCLFILENNQYGMGTSVERATANTDLGKKFESYAIEHTKVDGMDLEAVLKVAHDAADRVRETGKPFAVEALTYRIMPHGAADFLEKYRTKEEVRKWRERDPIGLLEKRLEDEGVEESTIADIRTAAKAKMDEAVKFAEESPEPDIAELLTDVYTDDAPVQAAG